jgi:hypothetical protein
MWRSAFGINVTDGGQTTQGTELQAKSYEDEGGFHFVATRTTGFWVDPERCAGAFENLGGLELAKDI